MALVRTDYGLIYNTDGSLCATLLPEGGVAVEEGTANLVNNPTEWIVNTTQHQETVDTGEKFLGCRVSKTTKLSTGSPPTQIGTTLSIADGEVYTASVYVKITQKGNLDGALLIFYDYNNSQTLAQTFSAKVGEWERLEVTYANNTGSTLNDVRVYYYPSRDVGDITYTAAPQLEQKPLATSFVDGSRADGNLRYPTNLINPQEGTVSFKLKLPADTSYYQNSVYSYPTVFYAECEGSGKGLWVHYSKTYSSFRFQIRDENGNSYADNIDLPSNEWVTVSFTWNSTVANFYVNGNLVISRDNPPLASYYTALRIGCWGAKDYVNALFDELLICPYAATDETIQAWYNLGAPFYDPREITTAELAARQYAEAQAELARVTAEAYADGRVTEEEQARIADAEAKLNAAKEYAEYLETLPIDAGARPINVKGAGADIEMDEYGIRATRKADGKKTFEINAETGDAFFSGNLSAESVMAGIVEAGGITAEYIKTGTLTYDTMNVVFAAINKASWISASGSAPITIDTIATTQGEWNIIRIDFSNFYGGVLRIRHNNLSILLGVAEIGIGGSKTSWLNIGFKLAGGTVYYYDFDIYITALEKDSTIIRLEPEQPPFSGTRYIFLKRHAIL